MLVSVGDISLNLLPQLHYRHPFILWRPLRSQRPTGTRLLSASGVASGDSDIVLFSQLILTTWCGDSEGNCVVAVAGIDVGWVLNGAVDDAIVVEVPGPSGYLACRFIGEVNYGRPRACSRVRREIGLTRP